MNDKFLQILAAASGDKPTSVPAPDETVAVDDFGAFGWLRGARERAVMLELRKSNGKIVAVGYGWLERVEFDPSEGITLHLGGQRIRILGRNLNAELRPHVRLFQGITQHRVHWVREAGAATAIRVAKGETVIERIEW